MKSIIFLILITTSLATKSQDCKSFFDTDKFTKDKKVNFYIDGYGDYTPFVRLTFKFSNEQIQNKNSFTVECSAGTGKITGTGLMERQDWESKTNEYLSNMKNSIFLTFLFDDETTIMIHSSPNCAYCNTAYFNSKETPELISKFKTNKVTDIRFNFNTINQDYSIPKSNTNNTSSTQTFFQTMINCLGW